METGKINVLHVTTDPENSMTRSYFYLTTATESEFRDLLDEFLVEKEFERNAFMDYVKKHGYICIYLKIQSMNKLN